MVFRIQKKQQQRENIKKNGTTAFKNEKKNSLSGGLGVLILQRRVSFLVEYPEDRFDGIDGSLVDERLVEPLHERLELRRGSEIAHIRVRSNSLHEQEKITTRNMEKRSDPVEKTQKSSRDHQRRRRK